MNKQLTFKKEDNKWYIDLPNWIGPHHALQMVCGADKMLNLVSKGQDVVTYDVITSSKPIEGDGILLSRYEYSLTGGAYCHTNVPSIHDVSPSSSIRNILSISSSPTIPLSIRIKTLSE